MKNSLAVWAVAPVLLMAAAPTPSVAAADVVAAPSFYTRALAWDFRDPICNTGQTSGPSASCTQSTTISALPVVSNGSALASLPGGVLDASASSSGASFAQAEGIGTLFDTLTFHGPLSGNVVITMTANVAFTTPFSDPNGSGSGEAYISLEGLNPLGREVSDAEDCTPGADGRFCFTFHEGTAVISNVGTTYSITESFSLAQNPVLGLRFDVGAGSLGDAAANVEDPISISLPPGVTYTSASGVFLAGVPEPATWAILTAGLGLMGLAIRRRRGSVPGAA